ncbi:AbrB family transcriptional regulator [Metabacillus arenae]|uniref:AbrB family transcriptional regulator n=1 Tax=Metabacillus arenae TaxID=2771434 RepID=A0A926S1W0_9BACI|nr:AbrB family transcriptional regulator [Metabacillus arenae]MBD1381364.1 AbrB family transcriptional regulator [Metabacillus arenae]
MKKAKQVLETFSLSLAGGGLFAILQVPLAWILGPLSMMIVWRSFANRTLLCPDSIKQISLMFLGIYFGLSFTKSTFIEVGPYIIPFLILTIILILISVTNGLLIGKWLKFDPVTSSFSTIPGGLSEMVVITESLKGNVAMVTIFQTVRLLSVVFLVPFLVTLIFAGNSPSGTVATNDGSVLNGSYFSYLWFILSFAVGWLLRYKVPAGAVIGPLLVTACLNISGISLPVLPDAIIICAQLVVGTSIGIRMSWNELKLGGKYSFIYFGLTLILIIISFALGYLFSIFTGVSLSTAILSLAPGGLVEMVLTANSIGADPALVSALQFIRLLFILIVVPTVLKWCFSTKKITFMNR